MESGFKKFVRFISFISVFVIGLVLLLTIIFKNTPSFTFVLEKIATFLAYFVVCVNAFYYVRTKRSGVYTLIYIIAVILITVCYFIPVLF